MPIKVWAAPGWITLAFQWDACLLSKVHGRGLVQVTPCSHSRLWIAVLLVQSVPYASAVLLSLINVMPSIFRPKEKRETAGILSPAE